jgi:hypothetical protein
MADSLLLDMLAPGFRVVFGQEVERGALIQPAFALADESQALARLDGEGVSAHPQQYNDD